MSPAAVRTSPSRFSSEIDFIRRHFEIVPFHQGVEILRNGTHGRHRASICFDDGFRGVLDHALPVLKRERVPHIIFLNGAFLDGEGVSDAVIAKHLGKGNQLREEMHPDRLPSLWAQIKGKFDWRGLFLDHASLASFPADLTQFGNHTHHHYWLGGLTRDQQEREIVGNHDRLKNLPGYQSLLALPFGTSNCYDETTLVVNDAVHGNVVIKAVGGIGHRQENGRWIVERIGMSNEKPRIDDLLRERITGKTLGYRLRKLGRKITRLLRREK